MTPCYLHSFDQKTSFSKGSSYFAMRFMCSIRMLDSSPLNSPVASPYGFSPGSWSPELGIATKRSAPVNVSVQRGRGQPERLLSKLLRIPFNSCSIHHAQSTPVWLLECRFHSGGIFRRHQAGRGNSLSFDATGELGHSCGRCYAAAATTLAIPQRPCVVIGKATLIRHVPNHHHHRQQHDPR